MPVRRDKRGRWVFRHVVELPPDHTGKRVKKRIYGTAPRHRNTKAAAQQAMLDEIERLTHPERFPAPAPEDPKKEVPTFREFVEGRFLEYTQARNKPSEYLCKKSALERHLFPVFGDKRLDEIRTLDIEDYKRDKLKSGRIFKDPGVKTKKPKEAGLSKKTIDNHLIILRRILNVAKEWEIIDRVPKIELYRPKDPGFDFLDFEEADRLIAAAATLPAQLDRDQFAVGDGDWGRMILLALKTGMRIGEILALRKPNANLKAGKVHVCEATTRGIVGTPKGGKPRDIPLGRQAAAALQAQRHLRGPLVFCNLDGQPLRYEQCKKPLALACERAGLRRISWHVLRHTFASHLVMRGVSLKAVQELLGHASIEMTMRYAHLAPAVRNAAVEALDDPAPSFNRATDDRAADDIDDSEAIPAGKKRHGDPEGR